jgi:hypothetical protein
MAIDVVQWSTGPAVGTAAIATATGYTPKEIFGEVLAVHVDYVHAPPAGTCDFTLTDESDPAAEAIVSLLNQATDLKVYPRRLLETNDGTDLTYDGTRKVYGEYVVAGRLKAVIDQADALDSCLVTVWFRS